MTVGLTDGLEIMAALFMAFKDKFLWTPTAVGWETRQEETEMGHRFCGPQDLGNPAESGTAGLKGLWSVVADSKPK